jgi:peptidyl-prolyl cis-trans isomerase B (cyclophilin B)
MRRALIAPVLVAASLLLLAGCAAGATPASTDPATPEWSGACGYIQTGDAARDVDAPPAEPAESGSVSATISTSAGEIPVTLDAAAAPCTVGSFLSLADQGYFDDTTCHRLTTSGIFVLQCGDPSGTGMGGPGYSYADELTGGETYPAGTVAMANAGPDTNGSQFFLVYEDTQLPPLYTVFGQMDAAGLAVVQQVAEAGAVGGTGDGAPATPVDITAVTID